MPPRLPSLRVPPVAFAHRGGRAHARENTLEAFALALRLGATGLESDAWLTADGQVALVHDGRVRPLGRGVSSLIPKAVGALDRDRLPAHVPTLDDLYASCGNDFELSLDVKDVDAAPAVIAAARRAGGGAEARLWLCHGSLDHLIAWRQLSPTVRLVHSSDLRHLQGGPESHAARLADASVDALNMRHEQWHAGRIALLHRFGRFALAWDCQHHHVLAELLDSGIDGVYGDHVDRMTEALAVL